jgi:hypothetical protein
VSQTNVSPCSYAFMRDTAAAISQMLPTTCSRATATHVFNEQMAFKDNQRQIASFRQQPQQSAFFGRRDFDGGHRPNETELSRAAESEFGYPGGALLSSKKEGIAPGSVGFSDWLDVRVPFGVTSPCAYLAFQLHLNHVHFCLAGILHCMRLCVMPHALTRLRFYFGRFAVFRSRLDRGAAEDVGDAIRMRMHR